MRNSRRFKDAYITLDYAREIQEERKVLIKAMQRAKDQGIQCKVIADNRDLKIRRRQVSATAIMTYGDWEEIGIAKARKLTLRKPAEGADIYYGKKIFTHWSWHPLERFVTFS